MLAIVMRLLGYRKETESEEKKGLRILAAAAVLTFGCLTMNAYAAEGWALSKIYGRILIKRKPRDE